MKRYVAHPYPTFAAVALAALFVSLPLRAQENPPKPGTILTVAGTGTPGYSGDGGPAKQAQLSGPVGLALDAAGNLYIPDGANHRVRKVSPEGTITAVAGTGQPGFSGDGGKATDAQFNHPAHLVVDMAGNLFIADAFNHRVRKVTPDGLITTYAGSGPVEKENTNTTGVLRNGRFSGDNGPATDARLNWPHGLAVDAHGNLFIADTLNHRVRKVSPEGVITTVAGIGADRSSGDGGLATQAGTDAVFLAIDAGGDLFIADSGYDRVRKVRPDGIITTVVGTGTGGFSGDGGKATDARLNTPTGLAVDIAGNLFVGDLDNYRVRKVSPEGMISTVAGIGKKPYGGDGSLATETGLRGPLGLVIDAAGNLFIADNGSSHEGDGLPASDRVFKVIGVAAPGLLAGMPFPP